jgi:type IV secretory pathway VirD2 relaxase
MADDDPELKLGRIGDAGRARLQSHSTKALRIAGRTGARAGHQYGHLKPGSIRRGTGTGLRAANGLIAPGGRRVIVKARYAVIKAGDLGAARAHVHYILRDGVTRDGEAGELYAAGDDPADAAAFLQRSENDPHQFRFIIAAEDGDRIAYLKPFIRDLVAQMEHDLDARLDWVAVDHFNTGHPHTHLVIRGRDRDGRELVMARDYIAFGVRARAQALVTLELGPETEIERLRKLTKEVDQERLTRLDRKIVAQAVDGILTVTAARASDPQQQSPQIGRLQTLGRLGLATELQPGVWRLDPALEPKLRALGERADTFKMMQRALREAGIERGAADLAVFERGTRKAPVIGKVAGVGMVDEITDRSWVVIDALDGRAHYAELGRLAPSEVPSRGMIVALAGNRPNAKPTGTPRLEILSTFELNKLPAYDGPTWLDQALLKRQTPDDHARGFAAQLKEALAVRVDWLADKGLVGRTSTGELEIKPQLIATLRQRETQRLTGALVQELKAAYLSPEPGARISGIYERSISTPTGRLAIIRKQDTFTLAPWRPSLEPFRGHPVTGITTPSRVSWSLDRGRGLPGRA